MFNNKKLLIFDLDGTLVNTVKDLMTAVNFSLEKHGHLPKSLEYVTRAIGNGVEILIHRCLDGGFDNPDYQVVFNDFRNYYLNHYDVFTTPYNGVLEVLKKLKDKGFILSVCTNKLDEAAKVIINKFYPNIFDIVQGSIPSLKKKPSPEMINKVIELANISDKNQVLYIGDTNVDFEVADNSNIDSVLVSYGYRTKKELQDLNVGSPIIDKIDDLLKLI